MRRTCLTILAWYASLLAGFCQVTTLPDSGGYQSRKLKLKEVNFVSSYYNQDGNNSAVTGGTGTEKLTDFSNNLSLVFRKSDQKKRIRQVSFDLGVDAYSSASSDRIDPNTISSASKSDRRIYPSLTYTLRDEARGYSTGLSGYYSTEYDYTSFGTGFSYSKASKDNNEELGIKLQVFFDKWKIILPIELRNKSNPFHLTNRNTYNASFIYSRVVNTRFHYAVLMDLAYQSGLLGTPFHRVYFLNNELKTERLPDGRFKFPVGIKGNCFLNDRFVLRTFYRFYTDSWKLTAHTFSVEMPVKITPFLSMGPVYRFYTQTAANYFAPYRQHDLSDSYYTSDYDLSAFNSHLIGLNFRKSSATGIFGIRKWSVLEIRYSYYYRTTGLHANSVTLAASFK